MASMGDDLSISVGGAPIGAPHAHGRLANNLVIPCILAIERHISWAARLPSMPSVCERQNSFERQLNVDEPSMMNGSS
ncbi:uncharacterized protein N7506_002161 [Penicillium brevicompactum]|uniref:uncharacterized protein n=1 Tax=Penicillium brevicompactum TaxID=5074 RepID=UPI0025413E47|nr:uncharacterized protein N7506_002161 [Penicillium brevicompactum]KAJ5348908.1 hypothetical protein N7506_002161 [Penicillium brevicompactum]